MKVLPNSVTFIDEGFKQPTEDELLTFIKGKGMDKHQMPARILYFDKFPSTQNSRKISKPGVKEAIMKRVEADPNAGITQWYKKLCDTVTSGFEEKL
ncbi:hypothetical protein EB796_002302 [Bugula neritina]|uniref:Uncharacterized protein n=1 Tax=Bugula neritina TaxID=10212 RepID=A0A7J7KMM4_BUGNE|nr:hypothetical protein EB796_002302 [Bugula neritina]